MRRVLSLGLRFSGLRFTVVVTGSSIRVQGVGFKGLGFRDLGLWLRVWSLTFRDEGSGRRL